MPPCKGYKDISEAQASCPPVLGDHNLHPYARKRSGGGDDCQWNGNLTLSRHLAGPFARNKQYYCDPSGPSQNVNPEKSPFHGHDNRIASLHASR